ncbi:hypothetical protein B6N60_02943 [Richelia sinica FACHB-800]|uniref:Uncharacterized protein n=1 Tax=Richelia sinica FACHB-800 TaxID=1357546 RepID=A0A975Y5I0_9NOST|nr:hypothetical protein B6N60_02943 [Richelia sinica FACHB-800]
MAKLSFLLLPLYVPCLPYCSYAPIARIKKLEYKIE